MFVNKRLKGFENRGFWWHPQVGTPTEPRRPYQTSTSVDPVTLNRPIRKPPTPQFQLERFLFNTAYSKCWHSEPQLQYHQWSHRHGGDTASTVGATANTVNGITVSGSLKDLKRVNPFSLNMRTLRKIA